MIYVYGLMVVFFTTLTLVAHRIGWAQQVWYVSGLSEVALIITALVGVQSAVASKRAKKE